MPHSINTDRVDRVDERSTTVVMCLTSERWPSEMAPITEKKFRSAMSEVPSTGENESEALYDER